MKIDKVKLKDLFISEKMRTLIVVVGLAAIVLIFISSSFAGDTENTIDDFNIREYQSALSSDILSMVTSVEGAGEAKILLTLENSYEYIYLDDGKTLQKVNEPTVRGVVIACKGGDSALVRADITQLLTTALNIPSTKVCISKLN